MAYEPAPPSKSDANLLQIPRQFHYVIAFLDIWDGSWFRKKSHSDRIRNSVLLALQALWSKVVLTYNIVSAEDVPLKKF